MGPSTRTLVPCPCGTGNGPKTGRPVTRGCGHDLGLAGCIADELAQDRGSDADGLLTAAYVAARNALAAASVWAAVEALASALVLRQTLSNRQAYRVIRRALPKGTK
jgi:hypothetical protein